MFLEDCFLSKELTLLLGNDFCELLIPSINIIIAFAEEIVKNNGEGDNTTIKGGELQEGGSGVNNFFMIFLIIFIGHLLVNIESIKPNNPNRRKLLSISHALTGAQFAANSFDSVYKITQDNIPNTEIIRTMFLSPAGKEILSKFKFINKNIVKLIGPSLSLITNYKQRSIDQKLIIAVFKIANVFAQVPFISDSLKVYDITQFVRKNIENDNMFPSLSPALPIIASGGKLTKNKRKKKRTTRRKTN